MKTSLLNMKFAKLQKRCHVVVLISLIVMSGFLGFGQEISSENRGNVSNPTSFFAIITVDMEASIAWYTNTFGFEKINERAVEQIGLKQSNLKWKNIHLELIQLASSVNPQVVIPGYSGKTRLTGLFKVGFSIDNFDGFIHRLELSPDDTPGEVVTDPISGARMIVLRDPDGNRIQIFEQLQK